MGKDGERRRGEEGFTLVELMVASGLLFAALTALAYTSTVAFADIGLARQRQAATGLANQAIEQVRAVPYDVLTRGLANSDLATPDPNIVVSGGDYRFGGERIPHADITGSVKPLVPHRSTVTVGPTTYTVGVYPTFLGDDPAANVYRVTVIVDWARPVRQGVRARVQTSTLVYSPAGNTATAPFATPRQPFLYGTAAAQPGSVNVTGTLGSLILERASLDQSERSSTMQVEQTAAIQGLVRTSGVTLDLAGSDPQTVGSQPASAASSNDPSRPPTSDSATTAGQTAQTVSAASGGSEVALTSSGADTATATTTATAGTDPECPDTAGLLQSDGLPCGASRADQGASARANLRLAAGATDLGSAVLASMGAPAGASPNLGRTFANRAIAPEGGVCISAPTGGDGCLGTAASRMVGTVALAGLPSGATPPALWEGQLLAVTGASDTVKAESGTGTSPPTAVTAATIRYWAGESTGYVDLPISEATLGGTVVPAAATSVTMSAADGPVTIEITPSLTVGGTSISDSAPPTCATPCARTGVEARSRSPVLGTIGYRATQNGATIADLTIAVDLGTLLAKATYTAAPAGA